MSRYVLNQNSGPKVGKCWALTYLCCTINTVPQFPHLPTEQRQQADSTSEAFCKCPVPLAKESRQAAGIWSLLPKTSPGRKASLRGTASWTRLSLSSWSAKAWQSPPLWPQNILKEQPLPKCILSQSHQVGTVFLLMEAEPTVIYRVLASQIPWMAFYFTNAAFDVPMLRDHGSGIILRSHLKSFVPTPGSL